MSHNFAEGRSDAETVALCQNAAFWRLYDRALARAEKEGWTPLEEVELTTTPPGSGAPTPPPPHTPPGCTP